MRILGISAFYHDSAAALIVDGEIVAAAQEERFSRVKHDARYPRQAITYCLAEAGIVCRSCGDACAASAIRFQPRIGLPPQAIVNEIICSGCGDCVAACPGEAITLGAARHGDGS